jgi:predicted Zn-dependent peptidase
MARFRLSRLDSGVRVISERLPHVRSAAIGYWVGVGSRDERETRAGVSHFIEHLLFKGSNRWSALEIAEIFDELGGELNAATSREHTVVYSRVPDNRVETALEVMGDMVFSPRFDDLDSEREVVLEEIAMYEDSPQDLVHDLLGEAVFEGHALGRRVIGSAEVISTVSRRALRGFHRSFYAPANIVVAAAGAVDHDALVAGVERTFAARVPQATGTPPARQLLRGKPAPGLRFQRKETEQYHVCLGAPGVSRSDPRRFAASVLDAILGGSASSRLFQEIREKRGLAYSVYSFGSQYADTGQIGLYVGTREDNLVQALEIACAQVADIAAGNLGAAELARAKENLKGRMLLSMESTSSRMQRLGKSLITDTEILSLERLIAEIEAVEAGSVCELAAALLAPGLLSAAAIGPREERVLAALEGVTPALAAAA